MTRVMYQRDHDKSRKAYLESKVRFTGANKVDLSTFPVCRCIHAEAVELFYSENIFYFEQHLTRVENDSYDLPTTPWGLRTTRPDLPTHLTKIAPKYLSLIKKIGFAVTDESVTDHCFRLWQDLCAWINKNLPNLQHTYIFLFGPAGRPSDRFLVKMIRFLDSIPGDKTIEFRGSNNSKSIFANILAPVLRGRSEDSRTIRILGGCYCQCWASSSPYRDTWMQPDTLWPWLSDWSNKKATIAFYGSITPKFCQKHKGPLTGCLLCWKRKQCSHDARLRPGRIVPEGDPGTAHYTMW
ncbi:MAG: hypothetical protein Q9166_007056 [cf. Caloplaca sp. 2 TL-2023]